MLGLNDAAIFIIKTLGSLYLLIVLLRFILQLVRANFYNPLCQFIVKATQPLLKPLRRVIPSMFGLDMSSLVLALIVQMLLIAVIVSLKGFMVDWVLLVPWSLIALFSLFLNILFYAMIISVILSWVAPGVTIRAPSWSRRLPNRYWPRSAGSFRTWAASTSRRSSRLS